MAQDIAIKHLDYLYNQHVFAQMETRELFMHPNNLSHGRQNTSLYVILTAVFLISFSLQIGLLYFMIGPYEGTRALLGSVIVQNYNHETSHFSHNGGLKMHHIFGLQTFREAS